MAKHYRVTTEYLPRNRQRGHSLNRCFCEEGEQATAEGVARVLQHLNVRRLTVESISAREFANATHRVPT